MSRRVSARFAGRMVRVRHKSFALAVLLAVAVVDIDGQSKIT